jgi:hypothetical protein
MPPAPHFTPRTAHNLEAHATKQAFHKPHSSMGATGHWVKTAGILAPLVIGEFVKDPDQRWRYIRMASVATALLSEALWTTKIRKERDHAREREMSCP